MKAVPFLWGAVGGWAGFDASQIEIDGANGGLIYSAVGWGDFDNDGDLDLLAAGEDGSYGRLRIYKNNGNGTFDPAQVDLGAVLNKTSAAWGDFDNDGDLDILISGYGNTSGQLRVYKNNGNGTIHSTPIEVDGANNGVYGGGVAWGDFDNDGDLDILVGGWDGNNSQLRIYRNNGNGGFDPNQLEVVGGNRGLNTGRVAWGDFDNDGDLDVLASGYDRSRQLRIYKNNGNGTINPTPVEVDGLGNGLDSGGVAWGDFDVDGDLDVLAVGRDKNSYPQLRVYKNNGNGTMDPAQIEVDGDRNGLYGASAAWGDFDNDGDLDILVNGLDASSNKQLRVYQNNGNGTFDPAQIEVDGANNGLYLGDVAWGDYDSDGDLDILTSGSDGTNYQLRVYTNTSATANTAPSAPTTLSAVWDYSASGLSTATFKWNPGVDSGTGATPANGLTYQIEISTTSGFTGKTVVPGQWATPGLGNYIKPPLLYDSNSNHGVRLNYLSLTNTTYYYRVKTIDAGLKESPWSTSGSLYTLVTSSAPSVVTDLAAEVKVDGQIYLTWTDPLNITAGSNATYDLRYSTVSAITNDTEFNNATVVTGEPSPRGAGEAQALGLTGLTPRVTYYFAIKSSNDNGTSALDISSPRASAVASVFDATQIEVGGIGGGLAYGTVSWGDFDNDGDLDILASGSTPYNQLRIYRNNGNGTFDPTQIEVDGLSNGLANGQAVWGDFDNDGDLDILASGSSASTRQLRIYKNNGNGTFDPTQIEVDGLNNGLQYSSVAWGDFDSDGDLDVLTSGNDGTNSQLRVYKNNGNGTIDPTQIEVAGLNNGLQYSSVAWGDFDNDGDLDVLVSGYNGSCQLRIYKNNGNGTINPTPVEVDGLNNGLQYGSVAWGDFDNDGDLDILTNGITTGASRELRVYKNNGNGTINPTQIEIDGVGNGTHYGSAVWGDYDNDGDLDVLTLGSGEVRVYNNNGNGTFDPVQIEVDGIGGGLSHGYGAWGDFDGDGDLDILAMGDDDKGQLRVYKNLYSSVQSNVAPTAPTLSGSGFSFSASGVSVASFTWSAGSDSGSGATGENGLTYDLQLSTTSNFSPLFFPGQRGASPRMGSYLKPPKIFSANTQYGVVLKSTDPWNAQGFSSYGLRTDTTYYYRVKTVDSALAESDWSSVETLNTAVAPGSSALTATPVGVNTGEIGLSWSAAGDDGSIGNLTGYYRIQYSTVATTSWSTTSTPSDAYTLTIATAGVTVESVQSTGVVVGLYVPWYFVLWTQDEGGNWSVVSATASATPTVGVRSCSISTGGTLGLGGVTLGTSVVSSTGAVVANDGNLPNTYALSAATTTVGSPWSVLETPPAGADAVVLYGAFDGTAPLMGDFGGEDVVGGAEGVSSGTKYTVNGTVTGVNVPAGENRTLWIRLEMPTSSQTESEQSLRLRVTAQPPD